MNTGHGVKQIVKAATMICADLSQIFLKNLAIVYYLILLPCLLKNGELRELIMALQQQQ